MTQLHAFASLDTETCEQLGFVIGCHKIQLGSTKIRLRADEVGTALTGTIVRFTTGQIFSLTLLMHFFRGSICHSHIAYRELINIAIANYSSLGLIVGSKKDIKSCSVCSLPDVVWFEFIKTAIAYRLSILLSFTKVTPK